MKLKHGVIILAAGYCIDFAGAWMKITHQANANETMLAATVLKIAGVIIILVKLLSHPDLRDLFNK